MSNCIHVILTGFSLFGTLTYVPKPSWLGQSVGKIREVETN